MNHQRLKRYGIVTVILILFPSSSLYAQGSLLRKGENGLAIEGNISRTSGITGIGAGIGYSIKGFIDFSLGLVRESTTLMTRPQFGRTSEFSVSAVSLAPSFSFHFLKNEKPASISLAGHLGYGRTFISTENSEYDSNDLDSYFVGLSSYSRHRLSNRMRLIFTVTGAYVKSRAKRLSIQTWDTYLSAGLELGLAINNTRKSTVFVAPGFFRIAGATRLILSVGYLLK